MSTHQEARHTDLAAAFAAPTRRADGLADLLPPRPVSAPQEAVTAPPAPTAGERATEAPAGPPRPARGRTRAADADDQVVNLPVYLPPDLLERLVDAAAGRTYADVLLEAFEHVDDDQLRTALAPVRTPSAKGIPARPIARTGAPGIQRQLRVTAAQLRWIEAKAGDVGAPSRSALCVQALRLGLSEPHGMMSPSAPAGGK
jgi:hypothetical protein